MARRHYRGRVRRIYVRRGGGHRRSFTLPLAPIAGLAAGLIPAAQAAMSGDFNQAANELKWRYLGIDGNGNFNVMGMLGGTVPLILGGLVHKFVGGAPLNVNRMLAQSGLPVIRI